MERPKFHHFLYEEKDQIAIFTAHRPEVLNALNMDCQDDLLQFATYFETASHLRVAIITGSGDKAFIAGADINNVKTGHGVSSLHRTKMRQALNALENCSKPIICAVNGYALGGGFEVALACDIRVASENAVFGLPETNLGILPGSGGTQRLPRFVGLGVAKDVIMGGRTLKAQEAYTYGLVMKVVEQSELMNTAFKVAGKMLNKGPVALEVVKKMINASMYTDISTGMMMESMGLAVLMETEDKLEGTAAFLEKRTPQFQGK